MKLCRFSVEDEPGPIRSGLYFDGKIYETDGQNALGVHDIGQVKVWSPVGAPPSIRLFDIGYDSQGEPVPYYSYANASDLTGPNGEVILLNPTDGWDFECRIAGVMKDGGTMIEAVDAKEFVLGYTLLLVLTPPEPESDRRLGFSTGFARDGGIGLGPFVVTPEELPPAPDGSTDRFVFAYELLVNQEPVARGQHQLPLSFGQMVENASQNRPVLPGDVLAWPPLPKQPLDLTSHGRGLMPTDKVQLNVDGLGILTTRLA